MAMKAGDQGVCLLDCWARWRANPAAPDTVSRGILVENLSESLTTMPKTVGGSCTIPGISILCLFLISAWPGAVSAKDNPDVIELLEQVDDLARGDSSRATVTMRVKTRRFERTMTMEIVSKGTESSLIRITAPAKEKGTATLKVGDQIWNYLPKVDRTIKVPGSMMSGPWMGSHFSNNDLVREVRFSEDFECALEDVADEDQWLITCVPHEDTPVVWGRVEVAIDRSDELPRATRYYDERGGLARTMTWEDVRQIAGRRLPTRMRVLPAEEPDEFTEMIYEELELDVEVPDRVFSLQSLKR